MRKITQILMLDNHLTALCDDGTLWFQSKNPKEPLRWLPMPGVPQVPIEEIAWNGAANEVNVDQLVAELLGHGEDSVATAWAAKSAPAKAAPGRGGHSEKPAAAPHKASPKPAADAEPRFVLKWQYAAPLAASILLLAIVWGFSLGGPAPGTLAAKALTADKSDDRSNAAVELVALKQPEVRVLLRKLLTESRDGNVVAHALQGLLSRDDPEIVKMCLERLDHPEAPVRAAAFSGLMKAMGVAPEQQVVFKADDPPETRSSIVRELQEKYRFKSDK